MSVCVILHFLWGLQRLEHEVRRADAPRGAALPVLALICTPALLCLRSRDGGGLGTRDWAPDDLGRREDNPDLGHGSGDESSGNTSGLVPSTFSLLEPIPKHLGLLWEELPAPGAPASLLPCFLSSLLPSFPASLPQGHIPGSIKPLRYSECVRALLEAAGWAAMFGESRGRHWDAAGFQING